MPRCLAALLAFAFAVSAVGYCPCRLSAALTETVGAADSPRDRGDHRCCRHSHHEDDRRSETPIHDPSPVDSGCECRPFDAVPQTERDDSVAGGATPPWFETPNEFRASDTPHVAAGVPVNVAFHPSGRSLLQVTRAFRC
jgi:hypothetical protein